MEHMRKRQHREVNPKNSYYDRFYVINYLVSYRPIWHHPNKVGLWNCRSWAKSGWRCSRRTLKTPCSPLTTPKRRRRRSPGRSGLKCPLASYQREGMG